MAQTDFDRTQPLEIEAENNLDTRTNPQGIPLAIPADLDIARNPSLKESERTVKMLPDRELKQAGFDMKINPKVGEDEKSGGNKHLGICILAM